MRYANLTFLQIASASIVPPQPPTCPLPSLSPYLAGALLYRRESDCFFLPNPEGETLNPWNFLHDKNVFILHKPQG